MAKLSRKIKEILQIVVFVLVVGLLVMAYVIYPLGRVNAIMGRADIETFKNTPAPLNDPTAYVDSGLMVDTFRVESDGLTELAGLYLPTLTDSMTTSRGTVVLLHADLATRNSLIELARTLHDSGFVVVTYDQRASDLSTGKYRGEGYYEASDLQAVISYLEMRGQIQHPLSIVGWQLGAEAGLMASQEEKRIDDVIAIDPYLTTMRMQDILRKQYNVYWFPFYRTVMWFWYNIRSGYAAPYRRLENIKPVACRTLIMVPEEALGDVAVVRIREESSPELLKLESAPTDKTVLQRDIVSFLMATGS